VHRVGRTARAGRGGKCFTLVRQEEVWYFKQMLKKAENSTQIPEKLAVDAMKAMEQDYKVFLSTIASVT
jgi:ATP-dependent RNA helicase DDX51/DBP6